MGYVLKLFDMPLVWFDFVQLTPLAEVTVEVRAVEVGAEAYLPLDFLGEVTGERLLGWLKRRLIPKNRAYVDSFLAKLGLNPRDTQGIIDVCLGLSLNDCYWVVREDFVGTFAGFNLYDNDFNRALGLIAYTGYGETRRGVGFTSSPELTTHGVLAKCWRRLGEDIVLFKSGSVGAVNAGNEPYSEFYACQVAARMGLEAVVYGLSRWKGRLCSTCKLFTSKDFSYVAVSRLVVEGGWEAVLAYYRRLGDDYYAALVDMLVFDAVICNEDRHFGNFGFLVDSRVNRIVRPAPLFDQGLSLFNFAMESDLNDIEGYAGTRLMATGQDFVDFVRLVMTAQQRERLRRLIGFKFKRHNSYNLSIKRLKSLENFIQWRVNTFLGL